MAYPTAAEVKARRPKLGNVDVAVVARALAAAVELVESYCDRTFERVCPQEITDALDVLTEDRALDLYSRVPDKATAVITDSGSYSVGQADWSRGRPTGLASVDAMLNRRRSMRGAIS